MILYFSGTGNSKYLADRIANITHDKEFNINDYLKAKKQITISDERIVVCVPTYAWRIPKIVSSWLLKNNYQKNAKIWFVMSCGSDIGAATKYNKAITSKLNLKYMGTAKVVLPENYIAMFNSPSLEEEKKIIKAANDTIIGIIKTIIYDEKFKKAKTTILDLIKSDITNPFFYTFYVKADKFYVKDSCIGCGLCEKLCPLNNIVIIDGKVKWNNNCTQCMACISYCPKEAIEYGNISKGKRRYYFGKDK